MTPNIRPFPPFPLRPPLPPQAPLWPRGSESDAPPAFFWPLFPLLEWQEATSLPPFPRWSFLPFRWRYTKVLVQFSGEHFNPAVSWSVLLLSPPSFFLSRPPSPLAGSIVGVGIEEVMFGEPAYSWSRPRQSLLSIFFFFWKVSFIPSSFRWLSGRRSRQLLLRLAST